MDCLLVGRIFLVVACCVGLIIQIKSSLHRLSALDIIRISYTEPLETGIHPEISFCLAQNTDRSQLENATMPDVYAQSKKIWEAVPYFHTGNIPDYTTTPESSFSSPFQFPNDSAVPFEDSWLQQWHPGVQPVHGRLISNFCYNFVPKVVISTYAGVTAVLNLTEIITPYHLFYVHMHKSMLPTTRKIFGTSWMIAPKPTNPNPHEILTIGYEVKKIVRQKLNHPNKYPCVEDGEEFDYISDCFLKYSMQYLNCVPPNPYKNESVVLNGSTIRLCNKQEDVLKYWELIDNLNKESFYEFVKKSKCRVPCTREEYQVLQISEHKLPCVFPAGCCDLVWIFFTFRDREMEYITEKWLYDFDNFVADVGGYMGLYLGASLLMIYDQVSKAVKWVFKKLFRCQILND